MTSGRLASAKGLVPARFRHRLRRSWTILCNAGTRHFCPICRSHLRRCLPYGRPLEPDFLCPVCRSKPPHRLAALYFHGHPEAFRPGGRVVHVAPEAELGKVLRRRALEAGMSYRAGGIADTGDDHLDMLHLPFPDDSIDLLYCCHVLNSLQDDGKAMREVERVLRPDGVALLQVPAFHEGVTTLETHSSDERMAVFGDEGISRSYTDGDYVARLEAAGFVVFRYCASDLSAETVRRCSLKREVLHVCRKRSA